MLIPYFLYNRVFVPENEETMKKTVNVGLIGFGTVGTGVVKLFNHNGSLIDKKAGLNVRLKKIVDLDIKRDRGVNIDKYMLSAKAEDILNDPEIDIVIELMGGYKPAIDFISVALKNKKHVVTANKKMVSKYWEAIWPLAKKNSVEFMLEASVAGGIPVIKGLREGLSGNRIQKIMGILNGTCNYILTNMTLNKMTFADALAGAQAKGFAEADPTMDIEGFDTMHKAVILSSMAFGQRVKEEDVHVEGIKGIDYQDIKAGDEEFGYVMKLLAIAEHSKNGINVRVHPAFVSKAHLLASVNYEFNAVHMTGDAVGDVMFYGRGAGELPTASAVIADVIDIAKIIADGAGGKRYENISSDGAALVKMGEIESKYYMRFNVMDKAGVLAEIAGILGKHEISIKSVIQKERASHKEVPVVIMSYEAKEANVMKALKKIDALSEVKQKTVYYRVVE